MNRRSSFLLLTTLPAFLLASCATTSQTGYISDYSSLEKVNANVARYIDPELHAYHSVIVEPVAILYEAPEKKFSKAERREVATYMRNAFIKVLRRNDYKIVTSPGPGVARLRAAITDVDKAIALLSLHPAAKLTGAAAGGASMEMEVVDSLTGEQLAATVKKGRGNQFELDHFDELDDIMDVIDKWAEEAEEDLRTLRSSR